MTHETFRKAIAEALDPEYAAMIPEHGEHIFSEKFERRMKKLISRRSKPYYSFISTGLRRAACIVVMFLVVSITTVMSVEALRKPFLDFLASIFGDHTTIESVLDLEGDYPKTIEERYEITKGLEGFVLEDKIITTKYVSYIYRNPNNNSILNYMQRTVIDYKNEFNTENSNIYNISFGKYTVLYYVDDFGYNNYIWNNGEYIIKISSNIDKNRVEEIIVNITNDDY